MANGGVLPKLMLNGNNAVESWKQWLNSFQIYLVATETNKKEERIQIAQLLHFAGPEAQKIYSTFKFNAEEQDKLDAVIKKFDNHFAPRQNKTFLRYKFFTTKQTENMSLEEFVTELKKQAQACEFGQLHDELIKLTLICGTNNEEIRRRLLQEDDADLEKAIKLAAIIEQSKKEANKISTANNSDKEEVDRVTATRSRPQSPGPRGWRGRSQSRGRRYEANGKHPPPARSKSRGRNSNNFVQFCSRCGLSHYYNKCPAYQKTCGRCRQLNHFASMCRNKNKVNSINVADSVENNVLYVGSINNDNILNVQSANAWVSDLKINGKNVTFKLDTGAMANVLSIKHFLDLKLPISLIQPTKITLKSYTGDVLPLLGQCELECEYLDNKYMLRFHVINDLNDALLGLRSCMDLNLITKNLSAPQAPPETVRVASVKEDQNKDIVNSHRDVFGGIGCINPPYHIQLIENAQSVISPIRRVPFALLDKLKETLAILENQNIIKKVEGPSDWVHPLVLVKKSDDSLRVCLDPLHLNRAIKREHCKLLTLEEIACNLKDAKYFSKLDASQAFYQIPLDDASSRLCTVGTPFGRYRFLRLPYGVKCAPEVFNERFRQIFDLQNVAVYIDDIILWGKTKDEHDIILKKVLDIARQNNVKFNLTKCKFGVSQIMFMGHVITADGISIDSDRVKAIREFPEPKCKKDLQRLLGVVNYLSKYIPNFSEQTKPLRDLLKKETHFAWEQHHENAFDKIKDCLLNSPVLRFFDPKKEIVVSVDASQNGLGACLMQDNQPIYYASKALTPSQTQQPQITKELLAIWFGLSKFHDYVFARHVIVETDHKPLLTLMKKPLNSTPARLQRILLSLQKYQFTLIYKKGKDLVIADTLSRACLPGTADNEFENNDQICVVAEPHVSDEVMQKIKTETEKDTELQYLKAVILNGWPKNNKSLNNFVRPYVRYKSELTIEDEIIYKGNSCVIPTKLRKMILEKVHYSHLGYNKCVKLAQESVFWPTIKNEIKQMIDRCAVCQKYAPTQKSEPLKSHEILPTPWAKIGCDLFELRGIHYLIVVDYYSKFIEVEKLRSTSSYSVINIFKPMFARFGVPNVVITDGGTQFTSREFQEFAKQWQFEHKVSSPTHSQSNGMAERHVQVAKNLIKKAIESNRDIHLALLQLRNTPIFGINSPFEILMSRAARNPLLPYKNCKLKPHVINQKEYQKYLQDNQSKQAKYYNIRKNANPLSALQNNTRVLIQLKPGEVWHTGTIIKRLGDRRYKVFVDNKGPFIRNRKFLKPSSLKSHENVTSFTGKQLRWSDQLISEKKEEYIVKNKNNISTSLELPRLELSHLNELSKNSINNETIDNAITIQPSTSTGITDSNRHIILGNSETLNTCNNSENYISRYGRICKPVKNYVN